MILPDTSIWVEYLQVEAARKTEAADSSPAAELDLRIQRGEVITCGAVMAELLAGARGKQRDQLAKQLSAQGWIDLRRADWLTVGNVAAQLQELGETVPLIDVQIAVCAVRAEAEIWTLDSDFQRIAELLDDLQVSVFEDA